MIYQLMRLDMRLIKPYMKSTMLLLFVAGPLFAIGMKSTAMMVMYIALCAIMSLGYPFTIIEKKNGNLLYGVLPVSKEQAVTGRYLFIIAITVAAALIMVALSLIVLPIIGQAISLGTLLNEALFLIAGILLVAAFQVPLFYKLGFDKAKLWSYLPFGFIALIPILFPSVEAFDFSILLKISPICYVLAAGILLFVSYIISRKVAK